MKKVFVGEFRKEDLKIFDDGINMEGNNQIKCEECH